MNNNFKTILKIFIALLLLSLAWLTGYFMNADIAKNKMENTIPETITDNSDQSVPDVPPIIGSDNNQPISQKQNLPSIPPIIK